MAKYMVVYRIDGEVGASFYNDYVRASNERMNIECGLGAYAEFYVYSKEEGYTLID